MSNKKLVRKFDKQSKLYEKGRNNQTLSKWRQRIIPSANGNVLEVGVGVGANFSYYNENVSHITAVDFSSEMIKRATTAAENEHVSASFMQSDIAALDFAPKTFDTIVSTLTVCGYENPLETLENYRLWCKKDGMILFLEHGLSSNFLLAATQKVVNPVFKQIGGCHCKRKIPELIESAGLEIVRSERYWKDIISLVWAKPMH